MSKVLNLKVISIRESLTVGTLRVKVMNFLSIARGTSSDSMRQIISSMFRI